jgi:hypothetical protein
MTDHKLYTAIEVAKLYGISPRRAAAIAQQRGFGRRGRDWIFTAAEVKLLKPQPPGRPRKSEKEPPSY